MKIFHTMSILDILYTWDAVYTSYMMCTYYKMWTVGTVNTLYTMHTMYTVYTCVMRNITQAVPEAHCPKILVDTSARKSSVPDPKTFMKLTYVHGGPYSVYGDP